MNRTHVSRTDQSVNDGGNGGIECKEMIHAAIHRAKDTVLYDHIGRAGEHGRLLRLALNEAEGLAWQTEFPHLVFPELAREKAEATVSWHRRQRSVRYGAVAEVAFAE